MTKEAMKLALDALIVCRQSNYGRNWCWPDTAIKTALNNVFEAIEALEEALKQEQDKPVATLIEHYAFTDGIVRFDGVENLEQLPVGTKLYTTPQQRKPLTNDEFLELLLRKGSRDIVAYTTFVGGSIQMQGKIGLLKSAKVIKEFIEECYGIKE